jgi:nucleotide-binding universal stress UspA family protein
MTINRILIGVDDSVFAEHAAEYAFDIAKQFHAEVGLVNIVEPIIYPTNENDSITGMTTAMPLVNDAELFKVQNEASENIIDRTIRKYGADHQISHFTGYGDTADGIIDCSKEFKADLIVIGTHSRSGIDRLLMGSVAEHVVRHSEVPVLVVPFKEIAHS